MDPARPLSLNAGTRYTFTVVSGDEGIGEVRLYNPNIGTVTSQYKKDSTAWGKSGLANPWSYEFTPAKSGTYYLAVRADGSGQRYAVTVSAV